MLDPKLPDALVRMGQRQAVRRLGMREASRVEIQPQSVGFSPIHPILKMRGSDFIAGHAPAACFGVDGVQRQPVPAGNERISLVQVPAQFLRRARLARIISGHRQPAAQRLPRVLVAAHVIALPAVQGKGDLAQAPQGGFGVNAQFGVSCVGDFVGILNGFGWGHKWRRLV